MSKKQKLQFVALMANSIYRNSCLTKRSCYKLATIFLRELEALSKAGKI